MSPQGCYPESCSSAAMIITSPKRTVYERLPQRAYSQLPLWDKNLRHAETASMDDAAGSRNAPISLILIVIVSEHVPFTHLRIAKAHGDAIGDRCKTARWCGAMGVV